MGYKIAYLTSKNPHNRKESSGVYYFQSQALKRHCGEVTFLGPVKSYRITALRWLFKLGKKFFRISKKKSHSQRISRIYGQIFRQKLKNQHFDFILADKCSAEIAFLNTEIPIIYSTDATFGLLHNYYLQYKGLTKSSVVEGHIIEQNAINRSTFIVCATEWAARSVVEDYGFNPDKVFVLPRGANIDELLPRHKVLDKKRTSVCRLVFMGSDWKRKGLDIARETVKIISKLGQPVKLTVVGAQPDGIIHDDDVEVIPFLDKNTPEGRAKFNELLLNADFFILPTRAECMGISFCEASAFGLPLIGTDTGGVKEIVKNGFNGFALPLEAQPEEYAYTILGIYNDPDRYAAMAKASRDYFEEKLNWDAWALSLKQILVKHLTKP